MMTHKIYLSLISMWFSLTCFVDFVAVPAVFRNVSSRVEAGDIGMILFTFINRAEFIFAILILILAHTFRHTLKRKTLMLCTLVSLTLLTIVYNVHMTPQVKEQTLIMRDNIEGSKDYLKAQKTHEFYHSLYKKTDGIKIVTLFILIVVAIRKKEEVSI